MLCGRANSKPERVHSHFTCTDALCSVSAHCIAVDVRQTLKRGRGAHGTGAAKEGFEEKLMVEEEINLHTVQYSTVRSTCDAIHGTLLCVGPCSTSGIPTVPHEHNPCPKHKKPPLTYSVVMINTT